MQRRKFLRLASSGLVLSCLSVDDWLVASPLRGAGGGGVETSGLEFITPATQAAINRGLEYLAKNQQADGSFVTTGFYRQNVAVTALAGMACLASGSTPGRGRYGKVLDKVVKFLLENTDASGFINVERGAHGPMYGHGFAALFLSEVYGMTRQPEIREKLKLAINLIIKTQNREGGWRYHPVRKDADLSVTVCQIMALRAARNAGISVPKSTVDLCVDYVRKSQNPDGGFKYQLNVGSQSVFARSAAGLVALYNAGIYEGKGIQRGLRYIEQFTPRGGRSFSHDVHYYYGQYYAVQAMWHAGGERWRKWYPAVRDELLNGPESHRQKFDGSWSDGSIGSEYGTAMACIVLQIPNNFLPIFHSADVSRRTESGQGRGAKLNLEGDR